METRLARAGSVKHFWATRWANAKSPIQPLCSLSKQAWSLLERGPRPQPFIFMHSPGAPRYQILVLCSIWRIQRDGGTSWWIFQNEPGGQSCLFTGPETRWDDQDTGSCTPRALQGLTAPVEPSAGGGVGVLQPGNPTPRPSSLRAQGHMRSHSHTLTHTAGGGEACSDALT